MSDQEINIAIAEACGWKFDDSLEMWLSPDDIHFFPWQLPDYCNDLNAMHEVEKTIENKNLYEECLECVCGGRQYLFHATARQRAEAFLRKIWKWKENWK